MLALVLMALFGAMPLGARHAAAADYGSVYVHAHRCGSFQGIPPTGLDALMSACTLPALYADNGFWITTEGKTIKGHPSNEYLDWDWQGVPNHIFQIQGRLAFDYSTPVVYCMNGEQDDYQLMLATSNDNGGYVHPTMAGGYVVCEWFTIADGPENTGTISIDAHTCPSDFDAANAKKNDFYQACKEPENGATFTVTSSQNNLDPLTTGDNADGNVFWPYVVAEALQIAETPVAGYQTVHVYCSFTEPNLGYSEYSGEGGKIGWNLSPGEKFECDWYDAPVAGATVKIINHLCPDGSDLSTVDIYTLTATCSSPMNGISFLLESPGEYRQNDTGGSGPSAVIWFDVVPAESTITEVPVPGYLTPRVLCSGTVPDDKEPGPTTEEKIVGTGLTRTIRPGEILQCDWFNLPDHGAAQVGSIAVYPVACPTGFDVANSSFQDATDACQTPQDGTKFELAASVDTVEQTSGWWESGVAIFYGVASYQNLALTAFPRDGFTSGAVFCGQDLLANGQVDGYDQMAFYTSNDTIIPKVVPGAQEVCHWFMTPDGSNQIHIDLGNGTNGDAGNGTKGDNGGNGTNADSGNGSSGDAGNETNGDSGDNGDSGNGTGDSGDSGGSSLDLNDQSTWTGRVEITIRVCPAGFDPSSGNLGDSCQDDGNGIGFGIYSANQWWPQTSGDWADQMVIWDPVPQQDVVIKEDVPDGFATPIVFCGDEGQQVNVNEDGSIDVTIHDHETLSCTFYNVQY
jgi:hypothetical protein